jgi:SynChlorMet cassette radical SAM/SPASM protein ScmE
MSIKVMSTPRNVDICITGKCNLKCLYCSYFSSAPEAGTDLPTDEWLKFSDELGRYGIMNITLSGGEPLCRPDIKEIIKGIVKNRMRYSILTNGTLITDGIAQFISSTKRCSTVQVSIDGSTPVTHDICRGKGNFDRAIAGLQRLLAHKVPVSVRVTIHKGNVRDLDNIAKLLLDEINLKEFSTNAASYMGLCRNNSEIVQLNIEERSLAMRSLVDLRKKYPGRISSNAGPLTDASVWKRMIDAKKEGKEPFPYGGHLTGCDGAREKLAVRHDGVIIPCQQLSNIELGRINQVDIKEVWQNHPELKRMRERSNISLKEFDYCRDC